MLKDVTRYGLGRGLPALLNLASILVYSRLLSPHAYGVYGITVAVSTAVNAICFQWLRVGLLRFFDDHAPSRRALLQTIGSTHLLLAIPSCLIVLVIVWAVTPSLAPGVLGLAAALVVSQAIFDFANELSRARLQAGKYGAMAVGRSSVAAALGIWLATHEVGAAAPLAGLATGNAIFAIISLANFGATERLPFVGSLNRKWLLELSAYGLPLALAFALSAILGTSDRIMIGWLRGVAETGLYTVGADLTQNSVGMLMFVVNLAAYPLILAAFRAGGLEGARPWMERSGSLLLAIAFPAVVGIMLVRHDLAVYIIGREFQDTAARVMPWIAASAALAGVKAFHYDLAFQLAKRTSYQVWISLGAVVINIVVNLILIPHSGATGAAMATVVSNGVALAASAHWGKRVLRIPEIRIDSAQGATVVIATLALAGTILGGRGLAGVTGFSAKVVGAVVAYGLCLWSLNFLGVRRGGA